VPAPHPVLLDEMLTAEDRLVLLRIEHPPHRTLPGTDEAACHGSAAPGAGDLLVANLPHRVTVRRSPGARDRQVPPLQAVESEALDEGTLITNAQMTSGTNVTVKMTIFAGHPMAGIDSTTTPNRSQPRSAVRKMRRADDDL
jgi:hypothetical protein